MFPARVGHKSLMKIKQRKNYIHLAVTIVSVFSTPETFQGWFCLRQLFLSSIASARAFSGLSHVLPVFFPLFHSLPFLYFPPLSLFLFLFFSFFLFLPTLLFIFLLFHLSPFFYVVLFFDFFPLYSSFVSLLYLCKNCINRCRVCHCSILQYRVRCNERV